MCGSQRISITQRPLIHDLISVSKDHLRWVVLLPFYTWEGRSLWWIVLTSQDSCLHSPWTSFGLFCIVEQTNKFDPVCISTDSGVGGQGLSLLGRGFKAFLSSGFWNHCHYFLLRPHTRETASRAENRLEFRDRVFSSWPFCVTWACHLRAPSPMKWEAGTLWLSYALIFIIPLSRSVWLRSPVLQVHLSLGIFSSLRVLLKGPEILAMPVSSNDQTATEEAGSQWPPCVWYMFT